MVESLGERVKRLRRRRGLSQKVLAAAVGCSDTYISKLERGYYESPGSVLLRKLADVLGVTVAELEGEALGPRMLEVQAAPGSAGPGSPSEFIPYWPAPHERNHDFTAWEVVGTCLEPRVMAGHRVVIDTTESPRPGDIVAAEHDGERLVKILERRDGDLWLVALQDREPIKVNSETRILGVVKLASYRP